MSTTYISRTPISLAQIERLTGWHPVSTSTLRREDPTFEPVRGRKVFTNGGNIIWVDRDRDGVIHATRFGVNHVKSFVEPLGMVSEYNDEFLELSARPQRSKKRRKKRRRK